MRYRFFDARARTQRGMREVTPDWHRSTPGGLWRWMTTVADRGRGSVGRVGRSPGYRALPGLRLAAISLRVSMRELGGSAASHIVDARRLCAASFSAGKLVGYLEALEATDARLARAVAGELQDTIESVEDVRQRFERGTGQA